MRWIEKILRKLKTRPFKASACETIMAEKYGSKCADHREHLLSWM